MIGTTVSHYRILEKLGEGGMGVVYAAEDLRLGRMVAIKFLSASSDSHHFRARFLREARSISLLSHPNIATLFDYGETDEEQPFLGYQLAQGRDYSEATAARIDQEVEHMIAGRQEAVRQLLTEARAHLDALAEALLRDETLREDALIRLLGPRPGPVAAMAACTPSDIRATEVEKHGARRELAPTAA